MELHRFNNQDAKTADRDDNLDEEIVFDDNWFVFAQIVLKKSNLEFGINKEFNSFNKLRELDKEVDFMRRLVQLQKDIIIDIRTMSSRKQNSKTYYLVETCWVNYWRAVSFC